MYQFTGSRWTYPQLATALSEVSGKPVQYRDTDEDQGAMAFFGPIARAGGFAATTGDLEQTLGHPPSGIREAVTAALNVSGGADSSHPT